MKELLFCLIICTSYSVYAQAPEKISYQAVLREPSGQLISNQLVGILIRIRQSSVSGPIIYQETHQKTSNANGLVSLEIGGGTITSGSMSSIDWAVGPYYLTCDTDPTGGSSYSIQSSIQLLSVPYALHAKFAENPGPQGPQGIQGLTGPQGPQGDPGNGIVQTTDNGDGTITYLYSDNSTFTTPNLQGPAGPQGIQGLTGPQGPQGVPGNGIIQTTDNGDGTITYLYSDNSTFTTPNLQGPAGPQGIQGPQGLTGVGIVQTTDNGDGTLTYLYSDNSTFTTPNLQGPTGPQGDPGLQGQAGTNACELIKSGDGRIVVYTPTTAKGFGKNNTSGSGWYSASISGTILGAIATDTNIVLFTATNAYGFGLNNTSGSGWYTQVLSAPITGFEVCSGRIVVYNDTYAYGFGFNDTSGSSWYSKVLSGPILYSDGAGNRIVIGNDTDAYGFGYNDTSGSGWYQTSLSGGGQTTQGTH